MEQSQVIGYSPKNHLLYKKYFQKDIFDEDFLDEKDKALSPIFLSDVIPEEEIKKSKKKKIEKRTNFNSNIEKDIKYGSNIVYIGSKIDDNDNDEEPNKIMNQQVMRIIIEQKFCKKCPKEKKMRKKI